MMEQDEKSRDEDEEGESSEEEGEDACSWTENEEAEDSCDHTGETRDRRDGSWMVGWDVTDRCPLCCTHRHLSSVGPHSPPPDHERERE
jgi:hypothetical protein